MPLQDYKSASADNHDELMSCNHTELYQLCNRIGLNPNPAMSKHELSGLIIGTRLPESTPNPVDEWRDGIMTFLLNHWRKVNGQLMCPAKSGDKKACYQCLDAQVFQCMSANAYAEQGVLELIKKNPLEKKNMPVATPAMTLTQPETMKPEDAPRALEELLLLKRVNLVQLIFQTDLSKDAATRSAAMKLPTEKLAAEICEALKRWDAANGRAAPVPAQAPAAVAVPQEAAAPAAVRRKRTPMPETAAPQPATPVTMPAPAATPGTANELQKALVELSEKLDAQAEEHEQSLKVTLDLLNKMNSKITVLESALYTALSAVLNQSEMHFGIAKPDFLDMSLADVGDVSSALGKAKQG